MLQQTDLMDTGTFLKRTVRTNRREIVELILPKLKVTDHDPEQDFKTRERSTQIRKGSPKAFINSRKPYGR